MNKKHWAVCENNGLCIRIVLVTYCTWGKFFCRWNILF